jgi:L-lactate dehydrogenase (cytochrome)
VRLEEAFRLVRPAARPLSQPGGRRLAACHTVEQLRAAAERRLPGAVFDYIEGGADDEVTLARNRAELRSWDLQPRVLHDGTDVDLSARVLGRVLPLPFGLAPTGYSLLAHPDGESAAARAAAQRGIPYCVSNVATTSVTDVARAAGTRAQDPQVWTQLYLCRDREVSWRYLQSAQAAGSRILQLSVDTAVSGNRVRDLTNGFTMPPSVGLRTLADVARHPAYWTRALRGPAFTFANMAQAEGSMTVETMSNLFDPSLSWADIDAVREHWSGPILLKGPVGAEDARRALDAGIDGFHLSNHGGRQLDRCIPPIRALPAVRAAVGDTVPVLVDSGFRHGSDVAIALAQGADAVMLGRAYLYGLAVAGEPGVLRAIDIVASELRRVLQLLGVGSVAELRATPARYLVRLEGDTR